MTNVFINMAGRLVGQLTVIERVLIPKQSAHWLCQCICGNTKIVRGSDLRRGFVSSCGCMAGYHKPIHGYTATKIYWVWQGMLNRCRNKNNASYKNYGGRGISVCKRWQNPDGFPNFLHDMGEPPTHKHSIDRIDNDGNYSAENCRWATRHQQARNSRHMTIVTIDGVSRHLVDYLSEYRVSYRLYWERINRGWSQSEAIRTAPLPHGQRLARFVTG